MEINQPSAPAGAGRGAIAEGGQRLHSGILHRFLGHLETLAGHGQKQETQLRVFQSHEILLG